MVTTPAGPEQSRRAIDFTKIPGELQRRKSWVLWKFVERDGEPTKVPFSLNGSPAKANDPTTWASFADVKAAYERGGYDGVGYEFDADDSYVGVDLDGCRDPQTGKVADWAVEIIKSLKSYAEVSPSGAGVKLWIMAKLKTQGRKRQLDVPKVSDKHPAIEMYDRGRYFAVTGWRLKGPEVITPNQAQIGKLLEKFFPEPVTPVGQSDAEFRAPASVADRAAKYLAKMPPSISGQGGHNAAFHAACVLVQAFGLSPDEAYPVMLGWNAACTPPWSEKDLRHKLADALKQPGQRGYLRDVPMQGWGSVKLPTWKQREHRDDPNEAPYEGPAESGGATATAERSEAAKSPPDFASRVTTSNQQIARRIELLESGAQQLVKLGIGELDYALGGGVDWGEIVVFGARPGHGKSALGLQFCHQWSHDGMPCLFISEEMSALQLADRTLSHISNVPKEHWASNVKELRGDAAHYEKTHAPMLIAEGIGRAKTAVELIDWAVAEHKVECVIVDYVQLLRSYGKSRYEEVTNTAIELRKLMTRSKLVMVALCQFSREIEHRKTFVPMMSDLKETGQLEQDADVIVGCCWPHKLDDRTDPNDYYFFVLKNRNRAINQRKVIAHFNPPRQKFSARPLNYEKGFDNLYGTHETSGNGAAADNLKMAEGDVDFDDLPEPDVQDFLKQ